MTIASKKGGDKGGGATSTSAAPPASTSTADKGGNTGNSTNAGGDAQTSLTLDPAVIAVGFENDGQDVPAAGQVSSATSSNNFINFCLTVSNLPITNGKQVATGSCNPAPMGAIPSTANMPSSKFTFPQNFGTIKANTPFTISMAIKNMQTGFFVNAQANYFSAPQQLNGQGQIQGHSHVVVELLSSITQTTTTNPTKFAFFKGLNSAAQGGILTADVTAGLPAGAYKLSSINTAANHQPLLVPVAQHGSLDDFIYFTVTDDGAAAANSTAPAGAAGTTSVATSSAADTASTTSSVASADSSASVAAAKGTTTGKGKPAATTSSATAAAGKGKPAASTSSAATTTSAPGKVKATPVAPIAQAPTSTTSAASKGSGKNNYSKGY